MHNAMKFAELQHDIRNLYANKDASPAAYISCAHALNKIEDDIPPYIRNVRIAFLSSFTIQGLDDIYRSMGIFHNVIAQVYTAPYNQFTQQILAPTSDVYMSNPHVVYLIIDAPDILHDAHLRDIIETLLERTRAHVVLFTFVASPQSDESRIAGLNQLLKELYGQHPRVSLFDFGKFLDRVGRSAHWYTKYVALGDMRLHVTAFPMLCEALLGYAVAAAGNTKKCLVLDLDNTLWQGIAGEDGLEGVHPNRTIQEYACALFEKGIILAINSKNNFEDAMQIIEQHPDMKLKKHHFAAWQINWASKEKNMAALAEELNVGTESFVFVDDDPFQRERIGIAYPEIATLPPERLTAFSGFCSLMITEEDKRRGVMYSEERMRRELQKTLRTEEDFIRELALCIGIKEVDEQIIPRISQLTQKTNQFNLTTRRYTENEIKQMQRNGWNIWSVEVSDRFGDYGIVGVLMAEPKGNEWRVDTMLLSCRVLGRGVERHLIDHLLQSARSESVSIVRAEYCRSNKNQQTETFWDAHGFTLVSSDTNQKLYHYEITA